MPAHKTRFCPKGHDKDVLGRDADRRCRQCRREKYIRLRPAKRKYERRYYLEHKEAIAAYGRCYSQANKDRIKANAQKRLARDPEGVRARNRAKSLQWYWANHEKAKSSMRARANARYALNPQPACERTRRRKAMCADSSVEQEHLELLLQAQEGLCLYCRTSLDASKHLDHRMPLSRGGRHEPDNLAWACEPCNISKHDRLYPSEWRPRWRVFG